MVLHICAHPTCFRAVWVVRFDKELKMDKSHMSFQQRQSFAVFFVLWNLCCRSAARYITPIWTELDRTHMSFWWSYCFAQTCWWQPVQTVRLRLSNTVVSLKPLYNSLLGSLPCERRNLMQSGQDSHEFPACWAVKCFCNSGFAVQYLSLKWRGHYKSPP